MTILLLPIIILLIAIIVNVGNISAQRTLVQAASDAASHAGTIALDNTQAGWNRSLQATKGMFALYNGRISHMDEVDWNNPVNYVEYHGGGNSIVVTIERGSWDPDTGFVSYEEGSTGAPGWSSVAGFMAANAVRSRIAINSFANYFAQLLPGTGESAIAFENIVINGKVQKTCVAPFAVPVCSLLSMEGGQLHFDKDLMCERDRWVTRADPSHLGYWTPDAFYDPGPSEVIDPGWGSSVIHTPNYLQTDDNFAVVGFPASHGPLTEAEVRRIVNNGGPGSKPCVNAVLGESFVILDAGLQESATDTAIWAQIKNPLLHSEMKVEFRDALKAPNSSEQVFIQPNWPGLPPGQDWIDQNCTTPPCPPNPLRQPNPQDQKICNSHRFDWDGCDKFAPPFWDVCDPRNYEPDLLDFTPPERRSVWQAKVPVIGDMRPGASCDDQIIPPNNRFINSAGDIKIIGFVILNIYDVDIGYQKPHKPFIGFSDPYSLLVSDDHGANFLKEQGGPAGSAWNPSAFSYSSSLPNHPPACNKPSGIFNCGTLDAPIDVPESWLLNERGEEWQEPPGSGNPDPVIGWMYRDPPDVAPCNVVRTRIDCSTGFFQAPATSPEDEKARIVE